MVNSVSPRLMEAENAWASAKWALAAVTAITEKNVMLKGNGKS